MRPNLLRQRLDAGLPTLGTHTLSCWPTLVELVALAGNYHYIEFSGEYAPFTMHDLDNLGRAYEMTGLVGMIKVEQTMWTHQAMRALGSGFQSILFADPRSVEDVKACVAAVRAEAPNPRRGKGLLGVGMRRDVGSVRDVGSAAYVQALNDAVVVIMIEKRESVEDLENILSVPGVDMVQFGPADYAMSTGQAGNWTTPEVRAVERKMIELAVKKGVHPRVEIKDASQAARYIEMGVKHFCMAWDIGILHDFWKSNGEQMADLLAGKKVDTSTLPPRPEGNYR